MSLFDALKLQLQDRAVSLKKTAAQKLSGAKTIVQDFFEPAENGKVRVRDIVRELPGSYNRTGTAIQNFGKELVQGTARNIGSIGLGVVNAARDFGGDMATSLTPKTPESERIIAQGSQLVPSIPAPTNADTFRNVLQKTIFGDEDIESINTRKEKAPERATQFAQSLGFEGQNIINKNTALPFVVGSIAADLFGGSGPKKLGKEILDQGDDVVRTLANRARDFDNVDDFIKSEKILYHGTSKESAAKITSEGVNTGTKQSYRGGQGTGFSTTTDPKVAENFGKLAQTEADGSAVLAYRLKPDAKIMEFDQLPDHLKEMSSVQWEEFDKGASQFAKENGFDAIDLSGRKLPSGKSPNESEFHIVNSDIIKPIKNTEEYTNDLRKIYEEANTVAPENKVPFGNGAITTKQNGFITTIKDSPTTTPEVAAKVAANYNPISNKETLAGARQFIDNNPDEAYRIARSTTDPATAESNAIAQLLVQDAQNKGNFQEAIDIVEITARKATTQGQAIQALSMWNRLSPEGILKFAQRTIEEGKKTGRKVPPLTPDKAREIVDDAKRIADMVDGEDKAFETAKMLGKINDLVPPTISKKISSFQTIAQLLNPKTTIRNVVGNAAFGAIENVKDVFAAGLDSALSLATGVRTKSLPSLAVQSKGAYEGFRQGIKEAIHGVDTLGVPSQFELPNTPVFKGGLLGNAEKLLNVTLKAPDRAMYKAAYDGSLHQSMVAEGVDVPTEAMKEVAHHEGLYRTFQDDNNISKAFTEIKKALNRAGTKEFGLGDMVLKYPKTPANLIARSIDYSPAGLINIIYQAARPLVGNNKFDQRKFVEAFSRAITGTGALAGTGAFLHRIGVIAGRPDTDKDINAVNRTVGLGSYKINASALKRFALSGFDPEAAKLQKGDALYSYDWFQPASIGISMGANFDESMQSRAKGDKSVGLVMSMVNGVSDGFNTLTEQPLITNLTDLVKYGSEDGLSGAVLKTIQKIPASFVPTILNQVNQLVDNTSRNTHDPDWGKEMLNLVKARVPGYAQTLQPRVDVFGKEAEVYQKASNNLFNVLFNPAFKTVYSPTPEAEMVLDLYDLTGESKQAPRLVEKKIKNVNGRDVILGPKKTVQMQQFVGTMTKYYFHNLAMNEQFQQMSPEAKIKYMSNTLSDIGSAAKIVVLGDRPKKNPGYRVMGLVGKYMGTQFLKERPIVNQDTTLFGGSPLSNLNLGQNSAQEPTENNSDPQ